MRANLDGRRLVIGKQNSHVPFHPTSPSSFAAQGHYKHIQRLTRCHRQGVDFWINNKTASRAVCLCFCCTASTTSVDVMRYPSLPLASRSASGTLQVMPAAVPAL